MKRNGDVKLAAIPPGAAAILELARVDHLFEAFDSTADAVNSFHRFPTNSFQQNLRHEYATSTRSSGARHNRFKDRPSVLREGALDSEATTRTPWRWLRRRIAGCLLLLFVAPIATAVPSPQQEINPNQPAEGSSSSKAGTRTPRLAPIRRKSDHCSPKRFPTLRFPTIRFPTVQVRSIRKPSMTVDCPLRSTLPKAAQTDTQEPVGTAAATFIKTTGVAASRPAGAAIAPAKQRRARSILIKVAAIAGAGVAVGAVVALASASPSRPH